MRNVITAQGLVLLLCIQSLAAYAQTPPDKVTIYSDDFGGNKLELTAGKYDYMYLVRAGNMVVRSVKVPQGMRVIIYERDNFEGSSITLIENTKQSQLEAKGFGKITQNISIVVEKIPEKEMPAPGTFVTIYRDDFTGLSKNLVAGRYDVQDLGEVENDQLSSIKIPTGMKVTLYEHGGFKGRSVSYTVDTRAATLTNQKFNNVTSSIVVEQAIVKPVPSEKESPVVSPTVTPETTVPTVITTTANAVVPEPSEPTIYQGDFSGPSKSLPPGRYSKDKLGIANDELSSIKVPKGFRVTLYDGDAFEGKTLVVTADANASYFADNNFNNVTSSVWVEALPMITVYEGDYNGVSARLLPGSYVGHDFGIGNDQLSSVRIPQGLRVTLYENESLTGRTLTLTRDSGMDVLNANSFNNETSSLVVEVVVEKAEVTPAPSKEPGVVEVVTTPQVLPVTPGPAPAVEPVEIQQSPPCEMSAPQFQNAYKSIESENFMEEKMAAARLTTKGRCLSIIQIRNIATLFMSDDQSLEFVKYAYDLSNEKQDYYLLRDVFKFTSTREAFNRFLQGK